MALPDFLQKIIPQRNSADLKNVSRLKPPSIPRGTTPPQQLEIAKNFLSQVAGEIQNNHFIPDNIISWLTQHTSLTKQQLTSPDLTPKFINQELARLTTLIIESATQTQTAPEVNTQNTTDNLDRLASRALPDLKRFIAEGVPHPEIALIILNNKSTTTRLQKIFTEELQNSPSNLQRAFTNTLIRASRTDPAVAAVMALAAQHTQGNETRPELRRGSHLHGSSRRSHRSAGQRVRGDSQGVRRSIRPEVPWQEIQSGRPAGDAPQPEARRLTARARPSPAPARRWRGTARGYRHESGGRSWRRSFPDFGDLGRQTA